MSDNVQISSSLSKFRFVDILVLVVFISTAVLGLYLFRQDLLRTMDNRDMEPAGIITIRNNNVQRRPDDRVLWDRIYVNSLVYPGDLVRVAELSSTAIDIEKNELFLNQNTLIRIQQLMGNVGNFQVELREGDLSVTSAAESFGIMLDVMGKKIQTMSGSVLNAIAGKNGMSVQVSEGKAMFIQDGESREITEGSMIAFDDKGEEQVFPSAVIMSPKPNARYLKSGTEKLTVDFLWNRVNIDKGGTLRLEIAGDFAFSRNVRVLNGLDSSAQAAFDAGFWYWRLIYEGKVLSRGQLTIVNSSGPALISPVAGSILRSSDAAPQVRFQWADRHNAFGYIVEINNTRNFSAPKIQQQTNASGLVAALEPGTWYWRVKPVFISIYQGETAFSPISSFQVIKSAEKTEAAIEMEIPAIPEERITNASAPPARTSSLPVITVAKPVIKQEVKPEVKPEIKPEVKQEVKPEVKPEIKPEMKPEIKPEVKPQTNPEYKLPPVQVQAMKPTPPLAPPTPVSTPTPAVNPTPSPAKSTVRSYTIQPGDTLGKLAGRYYGDPMLWARITEVNNIQNPDLIYPGQVFIIP
jgi:LysM repeat protein